MFEEDKTHIEREKFLKHEITPSIVWTFPWPEGTKPIIDCCKSMLKLGYQKLRKKYIKGSSVDKQTSTTKKSQLDIGKHPLALLHNSKHDFAINTQMKII